MEQETLEFRLARLELQSGEILKALNELKDNLPKLYVTKEIYQSESSDLERRIMELEKSKNTALWAIIAGGGSLIFTLCKFVLGM